jgi:hypothetical protein
LEQSHDDERVFPPGKSGSSSGCRSQLFDACTQRTPPPKRRVRPRTTAVEVGEKISVIKVGTTTTSSLSGRSRCSSPVMVRDSRQKPLVPISIGANVSGCHFPQISGLTVLITINIWGSHTVFPIHGIGHLLHVACVISMYRATGLVG